jgi:hypothetical protein
LGLRKNPPLIYCATECTFEIKSRISLAKVALNKKNALFISKLDLDLGKGKKLVKCYIWSIALYVAETWTLRKIDQKYLGSFEMWCWGTMEKFIWTGHVKNEEVLYRDKEERNSLQTIIRSKANWIGHILRRNCLLKHVIEGEIEGRIAVTGR